MVALLNSSGGLEALYVFLTTAAFALFLIIFIAPLYRRLAIKTGSFEHGPSPFLMAVTMLLVLISAFVTDIIGTFFLSLYAQELYSLTSVCFGPGVHPIFGGFLAGVIIPHDHDLAIKITEKIEDIVNIVFLPLVSVLRTEWDKQALMASPVLYIVRTQDADWLAQYGRSLGLRYSGHLLGLLWQDCWMRYCCKSNWIDDT